MKRYWLPLTAVLTLIFVACPQPPAKTQPVIAAFTATPNALSAAGPSKLEWQVTDADTLSVDNDVGVVTGLSKVVNVSTTIIYTLTATNTAGSVTKTATVTVNAPPTPPTPPTPPSPPPGPSAITKVSGTLSPWTRGQRTLKATTTTATTTYTLASGNLATDGNFEVPLNDPPQASLTALASSSCTALAVTPANLKGAAFTQFNVLTATNQLSGTLYYSNAVAGQGSSFAIGSKYASYFYVDQDSVLLGTCNSSTIDLKLKKGWNLTLIERISATETKYSTDVAPNDFIWRFTPASGGTLKFDNPAPNVEVGKSVQLNVTATEPDGTPITNPQLVWTASDTSILEVTQTGVVTAKKLPGFVNASISVAFKDSPINTISTPINIFGLDATGGTFNLEGKTIGTAVRLRYQPSSGLSSPTTINYTITGPAGWNANQQYSGSFKPGEEGYGLLSEIPAVNGTYQIRANDPHGVALSSTTFTVNTAVILAPAANFKITGYSPSWSTQPDQPNLSWDPPADLTQPYGFDDFLFLQVKDETTGELVVSYQPVSFSPATMYGITWNSAHTYTIYLIALKGTRLGETRASRATVIRDFKPQLTQVSVSAGAKGGGYPITITGANFDLNTSVFFGNNEATSKTLAGSNSLRVIVPAGIAGTVDIKLTNTQGSSVSSSVTKFKYHEVEEFDTAITARLSTGPNATMYFVEQDPNAYPMLTLAKISFSGTITRIGLTGGAFYSLRYVSVDTSGNAWVLFDDRILKVSSTNSLTTVNLPANTNPLMLAVGSDNKLWIARGDANIVRMNQDGSNPTAFPLAAQPFGYPFSTNNEMLLAPDGNLWFTTSSGYGRVTTSGAITILTGSYNSEAMLVLDGAIWIGNQYSQSSTKVEMSGAITNYTNTCGGSRFARGSDGAFWCAPNTPGNYDAAMQRSVLTGTIGTLTGFALPPVPTGFSSGVSEVAADSSGRIWYLRNNKIGVVTP